MSTISCFCVKCGTQFFIKDDKTGDHILLLLPTMRTQSQRVLVTWADWIKHLSTHCPDCRYEMPPSQCIADLNHKVAEYKAMFPELEAEWKELDELTKKYNGE